MKASAGPHDEFPMRRIVFAIALLLPGIAAAAAAAAPEAAVRALLQDLVASAQQPCPQRAAALATSARRHFDLPLIAAFLLGGQREALSEAQRSQWLELLADITALQLATRFSLDEVPPLHSELDAGRARVHLVLEDGGQRHELIFVLRQGDGAWRIVNIVADGVSDLALRASQYRSVLSRAGPDGLLAQARRERDQLQDTCED